MLHSQTVCQSLSFSEQCSICVQRGRFSRTFPAKELLKDKVRCFMKPWVYFQEMPVQDGQKRVLDPSNVEYMVCCLCVPGGCLQRGAQQPSATKSMPDFPDSHSIFSQYDSFGITLSLFSFQFALPLSTKAKPRHLINRISCKTPTIDYALSCLPFQTLSHLRQHLL